MNILDKCFDDYEEEVFTVRDIDGGETYDFPTLSEAQEWAMILGESTGNTVIIDGFYEEDNEDIWGD